MKDSEIEWTDHTFNPWWGCTKVSPACQYCYAESMAKRIGKDVWGPRGVRRELSDANWAAPLKFNTAAAKAGRRARVFCASMADVFEDRRELDQHRLRLWAIIEQTPHLDWLLLTKRPQLIASSVPWKSQWPDNVWIGTTVESQEYAEERLPHLTALPAVVRFISAEPLMSRIDLTPWIDRLDWVIAGGESGQRARPSSPSWFQDLRDQCINADVAFFFKQWGEWAPLQQLPGGRRMTQIVEDGTTMIRLGKGHAGRQLDGATWQESPT